MTTSDLVVNGQQRSREEILKEAAKLAGDADRMRGETMKKVQAGADRKLRNIFFVLPITN